MAAEVRHVVQQWVAPLLIEAGFTRRRNEFARDFAPHLVGLFGVYPGTTVVDGYMSFFLNYGVVTRNLVAFREDDNNGKVREWLSPMSDLLMDVTAVQPEAQAVDLDVPAPWWEWLVPVPIENADEAKASVQSLIVNEAVPNMMLWSEPDELVAALRTRKLGWRPGIGVHSAVALALMDRGPSPELTAALHAVPEEGARTRRWIERRLADTRRI